MRNSLDNVIKSALENHEEEYNPDDWYNLEKKLNDKARILKIIRTVIYSVIVIISAGLILFFISSNNQNKNIVSEKTNFSKVADFTSPEITSHAEKQKNINEYTPVIKRSSQKTDQQEKTQLSLNNIVEEEDQVNIKISTNNAIEEPEIVSNHIPEKINLTSETFFSHPPKAFFRSDNNTVCANSIVPFITENPNISCKYHWDFGDDEFSNEVNPRHIFKNAGSYYVKLVVVSLIDNKCDSSTSVINVLPSSVADFTWKVKSGNQDITFESSNEDIVEWKWDFGDMQFSSEQTPSHIFNKKGNYIVSMTIKNNYGCTATCQKNIPVANDFNLLAPNAFSPNGDGKNDSWLPVALLNGDYIFSLTILDKNGNIAFKTTSVNNPWDGRHTKTNEIVKSGDAFKWISIVKDKKGIESTFGGEILITESSAD